MTDDDRVPSALLDALEAEAPPAGFADRVMSARQREASTPGRWRPRRVVGLALPLLVVAVIALFASSIPMSDSGGLTASVRTEHEVGARGVAVLEPGAEVAWRQEFMGAARVEQPRGAVFYRVEPGARFVVNTPAGEVRVTGTSFKVEVREMKGMKMNAASGALGAVLATVAWVSVYEGSVEVAGDSGDRVALAAGERAELQADRAPRRVAPGESRAELLQTRDRLAEQVETLEGQLKELMGAKAGGGDPVAKRIEQLEVENAKLRARLEAEETMRLENEGEAVPFPEELGPAYSEDGLMKRFQAAFARSGIPGEVKAIDCNEFPCIVYGEFDVKGADNDDAGKQAEQFWDALEAEYPEAENDRGISHSKFKSKKDDGTVELKSLFGVTVTPKGIEPMADEETRKKVHRRVRWRNQTYMDGVVGE